MLQSIKFVIALVRPFKLDEVLEALTRVGIQRLTVTEVKGWPPRSLTRRTDGTKSALLLLLSSSLSGVQRIGPWRSISGSP